MKTDLLQSCAHCWVFQICWHIECHVHSKSFRTWNSSTGIPSPPLALLIVVLPKAHLTAHSRMSGYRWGITPSWLSGREDLFCIVFFVYSRHLPFISSASVRSIPFLSFIVPIFAWCSLGISNFPEEISSLSHSIVFLYFFALITEKGFLISPCYSWNSAFRWVYLFFSSLPLASLLFTAICKTSSDSHFAFFAFLSWGWSQSLTPVQCHKPPSIVLQALYQI